MDENQVRYENINEEKRKNPIWSFLSIIFVLIIITMLVFYWVIPFGTVDFGSSNVFTSGEVNSNFSLGSTSEMQFYSQMRFPNKRISYNIEDCTLQKKDDMENAFDIISEKTILEFYPVNSNEEISISCESKNKIEGGMFIAGEGGPTNITQAGESHVILHGSILLIRDFKCEKPVVGIHELLHVLGFNHSSNSKNMMYPVAKCGQTIGEDIPNFINEIYTQETLPDLLFEEVSAVMHGRYLDVNISVRNNGLMNAEDSKILIYADDKQVKDFKLEEIKIGYGRILSLTNVWIPQINVDELRFVIDSDSRELDKENNEIILAG